MLSAENALTSTYLKIYAKTFIPQAFQLTLIQTFRKYLGAFDKVKEYTHNHQTNNTYQNVVPQTLFPTLTFLLK